jgi:hypothetical protein
MADTDAGDVTVRITRSTSHAAPPSTSLDFEVRNHGATAIWLVDDAWLIWRQQGSDIELSFARGRTQPGTQVFGYFPPSVEKVEPGASVVRTVRLTWPQRLDRLWNAQSQASPAPGEYNVSIRIGYGVTSEPDPPGLEDVQAPVFRWQKEVVSPPAAMEVPNSS